MGVYFPLMFDIPSRDRSPHGKLFTSSLLPGELKSSPHDHDIINPLYHPYEVYSTYILPAARGRMADMYIFCRSAHHAPEDVEPACRESLQKLQLDYLDLYLVCFNGLFPSTLCVTWSLLFYPLYLSYKHCIDDDHLLARSTVQ